MYAAGTGFTPMVGLILQAAQLDPNPDRLVKTNIYYSSPIELLTLSVLLSELLV